MNANLTAANKFVLDAYHHVRTEMPWWNASVGADHIWVFTHDIGYVVSSLSFLSCICKRAILDLRAVDVLKFSWINVKRERHKSSCSTLQ